MTKVIILYLNERKFRPYWFETGTPEFLIKLLIQKAFPITELENLPASDRLVGSFDIDCIEPINTLFQTGYLTITRWHSSPEKGTIYFLSYPNKEVKLTLNDHLFAYLTQLDGRTEKFYLDIREVLSKADLPSLENLLKSLFARIPSDWHRRNEIAKYEGYYTSVIYSFFVGAGFNLIPEDTVSTCQIDLTVLHQDKAFIFEFKVLLKGEKKVKPSPNSKKVPTTKSILHPAEKSIL